MDVYDIAAVADLDSVSVQRALRALGTEPFFAREQETANGDILWVGKPTGEALRVAGQWPSPKALLDRLIDALETAGDDKPEYPRSAAS